VERIVFSVGKKTVVNTGRKGDTGEIIKYTGKISRKGQKIERKRGKLYTCA